MPARTICEGLDAVLGALGIQQDGQGLAGLLADALDQSDLLLMLGMSAVREVQAGNIHAGQYHLSQNFFVLAGRADGADNFGFTHWYTSQ